LTNAYGSSAVRVNCSAIWRAVRLKLVPGHQSGRNLTFPYQHPPGIRSSRVGNLQNGKTSTDHFPGTLESANSAMVWPAISTSGSLPLAFGVYPYVILKITAPASFLMCSKSSFGESSTFNKKCAASSFWMRSKTLSEVLELATLAMLRRWCLKV